MGDFAAEKLQVAQHGLMHNLLHTDAWDILKDGRTGRRWFTPSSRLLHLAPKRLAQAERPGDEACGEPEEGNHELGSSEPTRRDPSRLSLCSNWMRQPKVLEFPAWKAIPSLGSPVVDVGNASCEILRCTQAGAGPKNAQADGTCCFLAKLWRQLQVFKDALVDATAERPNTCFKVQSLEYEYSIYIYMYVCICI